MSLSSNPYKILSSSLLSNLNPYVYKITGKNQCGFLLTDKPLIRGFTGGKMGVQWDSTSAIHRLYESL
jgi:hypothetical protein